MLSTHLSAIYLGMSFAVLVLTVSCLPIPLHRKNSLLTMDGAFVAPAAFYGGSLAERPSINACYYYTIIVLLPNQDELLFHSHNFVFFNLPLCS